METTEAAGTGQERSRQGLQLFTETNLGSEFLYRTLTLYLFIYVDFNIAFNTLYRSHHDR